MIWISFMKSIAFQLHSLFSLRIEEFAQMPIRKFETPSSLTHSPVIKNEWIKLIDVALICFMNEWLL